MIRLDMASQGETALQALSSMLPGIVPGPNRDNSLRQFEQLCLHLHTVATASLLVSGEPLAFYKELCHAAWQWCRLLQHQRQHGWVPPCASRNKPLLGALLAGRWDLAHHVASLSTTLWQEGEEYEDDACWAIFLQELVLTRTIEHSRVDPLLAKLDELGGEQNEARCTWAQGLLALDAEALANAFTMLLTIHSEHIESHVRAMTASESKLAPYRYLWFEGLALLRLQERVGIPAREAYYKYCLPLARVPMQDGELRF
jgi:hypothetical protein